MASGGRRNARWDTKTEAQAAAVAALREVADGRADLLADADAALIHR